MGKEIILLGSAGLVLAAAIFWKTGEWIPALAPAIIGLLLIIFNKEEEKVEKRRDK